MCVRQHGAALGRLCMALLGSQSEAEEVAQETFIAAHRGMDGYRGDGSPKAWLFGIARRLCAKRLAKRIRRERKLRLVHDAAVQGDLPDAEVERARRARVVRLALSELKPSERDVVVLRYESGLSYREIADATGLEEATARKRASRALSRLRSLLKDEVSR